MGNAVVIYKSKYGSTKKYAEWITKALNCEMLEGSNITIDKVNPSAIFDCVDGWGFLFKNIIKNYVPIVTTKAIPKNLL